MAITWRPRIDHSIPSHNRSGIPNSTCLFKIARLICGCFHYDLSKARNLKELFGNFNKDYLTILVQVQNLSNGRLSLIIPSHNQCLRVILPNLLGQGMVTRINQLLDQIQAATNGVLGRITSQQFQPPLRFPDLVMS